MNVPLGYICRNLKLLDIWKRLPISHAIINHAIYSKQLQSDLADAGIKLFIWTVNEPDEMRRFIDLQVDGIISDDSKLSALVKTP
jgi:glycerophosphoryl diester phosphodiesterase